MRLRDLVGAMENIAPASLAESWDNVGLLVGDPQQRLSKVMLTIDLTTTVLAEAVDACCDAVIAYHPPIFNPLKRVLAGGVVHDAIRHGIGIYSPHTALDAAIGGTNDVLADALFLSDRRPLRQGEARQTHAKLITFVPRDHVDAVAQPLAAAGAGQIGNYTHCSFRSVGQGTFLGNDASSPAVGQPGKLEQVDEVRLEMLAPLAKLPQIIQALREAHPYEEPAYDLVSLVPTPGALGIGRIGAFPEPVERDVLIARLKRELKLDRILVSGPADGAVTTIACCAGAGGSLLDDALRQGAEVFVTGEIRHHDALRAADAGCTVLATLHSNSERAALRALAEMLKQSLQKLTTVQSERDRDPFSIV